MPRAVSGIRTSEWCLGVDIFGHVDIIVQHHLLFHSSSRATGESRRRLSVARLGELLQASPATASAFSLQAYTRLGAATAAVRGQEG